MSNPATFWVWEFSESGGLNRLVMLTLAHRHNLEKKGCWPSYRTIARDCGISEATAKRAVQALVVMGEIRCTERKDEDGTNSSNFYELPAFERWHEGIRKTPRGSNRPPTTVSGSTPEGIPQTCELGIELGKGKTPLPPVNGGEKVYVERYGQTIEVEMGRRRRLPSMEEFAGARADVIADFLTSRGFPSRVLEQELA